MKSWFSQPDSPFLPNENTSSEILREQVPALGNGKKKCQQKSHLGSSLREQGPSGSFSRDGNEGEEKMVSKAEVELSHERKSID